MHLKPKRDPLGIAHNVALPDVFAFSHSDRDISLIPQFNFGEIDKYAISINVSS